jgi:hypothetical protein
MSRTTGALENRRFFPARRRTPDALTGSRRPQRTARTSSLVLRLSRAAKMGSLLLVIALALVATAFVDRSSQISLLKAFLILFLSVVPGWLYLQFIEIRGQGLYDEYVLNLYRMKIDAIENLPKPPPGSLYWDEWNRKVNKDHKVGRNIYLKKFQSVYGDSAIAQSRRRRSSDSNLPAQARGRIAQTIKVDAFFPVIMLTMLLCVGWSAVLVPEAFAQIRIFTGSLTGLPETPVDPLRFAFIGSYAFMVQQFIRRYFQSDLKTHAYISALGHLILAGTVIVALHPIFASLGVSAEWELAIAWTIGFFPDFGLKLLWKSVIGKLGTRSEEGDDRYSLKVLDGINFWNRARLLEEGIEDMQNLSTANLVELMLNTRVPINRVIDWVDQSFLYLRVTRETDREELRKVGIRTATDLMDAFEGRDGDPGFRRALLWVLNPEGKSDGKPSATDGLRRALQGEVNLWHVRQWKRRAWLRSAEEAV